MLGSILRLLVLVVGVPLAASVFPHLRVALGVTFMVNTTTDEVDSNPGDGVCQTVAGGGDCSLRAAVQQANARAGTDEIVLPEGIFSLVTPGSGENDAATGDLDITESVTIRGAGADATIINAGRIDRVFDVNPARVPGVTVEMEGMTIQDGSADLGGGIQSAGTLSLTGVAVSGNTAGGDGGGIFSRSALTVIDSLVSGNEAASDGAGILCGGQLTLTNCTVSGNTAHGSAGGIDSRGPLTMRFSTVSGNSAATGGGVVYRTTMVNTSVGSTVIADNSPGNCSQAVTSAGNNLEATNTCGFVAATDQRDTDPQLCPLDNYGGPTHTHALPVGSAARDAGAVTGCPVADQRGLPRPVDGDGVNGAACDAGAFEAQQTGGACDALTPTATVPRPTATATVSAPTTSARTPTPTATLGAPTSTPTRGRGCPGDCNENGTVAVDELVRGVNIALDRADLSTCMILDADGNGSVAVNELVTAVNSALRGCPG